MSCQLPVGLLLLVVALLCGNAFAARSTHWQSLNKPLRSKGGGAKALRWMHDSLYGPNDETDQPAIIAIKYDVPPSMHDDFIEAWRKLQDETHKEEGLMIYDLGKTTGDNVFFWTYGEWERMENYIDHFKSDYTKDFLDFLDDRDINWELFPLKNVTDNAAAKRGNATTGASFNCRGTNDYDPRDGASHVVIQYHVPPSVTHDFMDVWTDMAERTWDEKDNIIYALRKVANMNHHFIAYGTWESLDAFLDHFTSKHARKLREFLADNDILWYLEPVMKLGDQPEKQ